MSYSEQVLCVSAKLQENSVREVFEIRVRIMPVINSWHIPILTQKFPFSGNFENLNKGTNNPRTGLSGVVTYISSNIIDLFQKRNLLSNQIKF